jgi:predicted nuclease of predicted toxin-antitoxin system
LRFLADMGVSLEVVRWLRSEGHDAVHLREQSLETSADPEVFAKALAEDRVILTFDLDFNEIAALSKGAPAKVIVFRLRNTRATNVIGRLSAVLGDSQAELDRGAVVSVEEGRHRVRLLPVGRS